MKNILILLLLLTACQNYSKVEISNEKYRTIMTVYANRNTDVIATSIKGVVNNYLINDSTVVQSTTDAKGNVTNSTTTLDAHREKYKYIDQIFHAFVGDAVSHESSTYTILDKTVYTTNDEKIEVLRHDESGKSSILFFEYEVLHRN